jgi:peptidoglycan/xylan/chitin deacetylase (PgdA/CDA1 family)
MYHQIAPACSEGVKPSLLVTPTAFAAHMRLLHRLGWRTLRLVDLVGLLEGTMTLPRRRFVLTFDDAFLGVRHYAAPVLDRLGFTATVFAPTGLVGTCRALDEGPDHRAKALMSWDDLRRLRADGFDVGAHTRSHPRLSQLAPEEVRAEVVGSRDDITAALGERPTLFAYPYGDWSQPVAAVVRDGGFVAACATHFGRATAASDRLALPRIAVGAGLDLPHFSYRLALADRIARKIAASSSGHSESAQGWP